MIPPRGPPVLIIVEVARAGPISNHHSPRRLRNLNSGLEGALCRRTAWCDAVLHFRRVRCGDADPYSAPLPRFNRERCGFCVYVRSRAGAAWSVVSAVSPQMSPSRRRRTALSVHRLWCVMPLRPWADIRSSKSTFALWLGYCGHEDVGERTRESMHYFY